MSEESKGDRLERVVAVVEVAKRIADPDDPLGREARESLARTITLSQEGIELALTEHLEIDPDPNDVGTLVEESRVAPCCHVILSPSVCVAAHRAIALAVAASPEVRVKPSRRDPTLARLLVRELSRNRRFVSAGGAIQIVQQVGASEGEVVHAYGADETLRAIARALPQGATLIGHGAGFGVALVGADMSLETAAMEIARDAIVFDQRGCLSPRLVLVEGDVARAHTFARALHEAFDEWESRVPRGRADEEDLQEIARYVELMQSLGEAFIGKSSVVGVDPAPETLWIGPSFRVLHVLPIAAAQVEDVLAPVLSLITAVGADPEEPLMRAVHALAPLARVSALGQMQRPPFDGPVDGREDAWFSR